MRYGSGVLGNIIVLLVAGAATACSAEGAIDRIGQQEDAVSGCTYDWQEILFYENREGLDRSFVDAHEGPVAHRQGGCTGTLIGDGLVLTVRHSGCASPGSVYDFHTQFTALTDPVAAEPYKTIEVVEDNADIDLGIMRLPFNPEYRWGATNIELRQPVAGDQVAVIGHPGSLDETRSRKVVDVGTVGSSTTTDNIALQSIYMAHGASGSGVLNTATGKLMGVARSGPSTTCPTGTGNANTMRRIANVSEFIQAEKASGRFYTTQNGGFGSFRSLSVNWSSAWRHIVRGDFDGDGLDDLFFYEPGGTGAFYKINGSSQISPLGSSVPLAADAAQIVPLQLDGVGPMELYHYNPRPTVGSAVETFYATDGSGGLTEIRHNSGLSSNWRLIASGDFTSRVGPELLFYSSDGVSGRFTLYGTNPNGTRTLIGSSTTGANFSILTAGQFSHAIANGADRQELLAYDVIDRSAHILSFSNSGAVTEIGGLSNLPLITQITVGKYDQSAPDFESQVLFFSPTNGEMSFYSVSEGAFTFLTSNINRRSWGIIVAGHYRNTSTSELMLYDRYHN